MQIHLQIKTNAFLSTEVIVHKEGRLVSILALEGQDVQKYEIIQSQ